jgi:TolB-like protein/AraC-like DNA-binding protein/Tfp pilus assembly protein PilF
MSEHLPKDQIFISKLTEIIQTNIGNENFSIKELAYELGISHYSLNRRLFAITNKTFKQFLREARLQKALHMLQNEELTVSEIAYKVGFSSPAYFNTCFHEFFGYPPGKVSKEVFASANEINHIHVMENLKQKGPVWRTFLIISSLFFAVLVFLVYIFFIKNSSTKISTPLNDLEKSIAVLPFKNISDTLSNRYFIDGLMEEILTNLSKIHDLRVIPRSSVEQFREPGKTAHEIGKKLNADYIVVGSAQKNGNIVRLWVQLIEASREGQIWAETYEVEIRETKDIFKIQSQVAQSIAAKLKTTITPDEKQRIEKTSTIDLTAYDFYLRGREEEEKYMLDNKNKLSLRKAEELYNKALRNDSAFALAYTGLARVYWEKYYYKTEAYFSENYIDSVLILCDIALSYDDQLSDAHTIKGKYYRETKKPEQAHKEYDKAISLNPNDWVAYWEKGKLYYCEYDHIQSLINFEKAISLYRGEQLPILLRTIGQEFMHLGFPEKAYYYWKAALDLDGDSSSYYIDLMANEFCHGNFTKAIDYGDKAYANDSTYTYFNIILTLSHIFLGNYEKSLKYLNNHLESFKSLGQTDVVSMWIIGYIYWKNGYKEKAEYYFEETIINSYRMLDLGRVYAILPDVYYDLAGVYAFRGETDNAFKNLRIFSQKKCTSIDWSIMLKNDPLFDSIRDEPEFQKIIKEVEKKYQAEHERVRKWLEERGTL